MKIAPLVLFLAACTKPNPEVCCATAEDCTSIGVAELRSCASPLVCLDHRCVVSSDGGVDALADGVTDAPAIHAFDVAFPSEWKFSVSGPISGYILFVNTSANSLDMATLELKSIDDDHPTAIVRVEPIAPPSFISPGNAGGQLSGLSQSLLVDSGLVAEPRVDTNSDYLSLEIQNAPPGQYDINVSVVLALESVRIPLEMRIQMVSGPEIWTHPLVAKRTAIFR